MRRFVAVYLAWALLLGTGAVSTACADEEVEVTEQEEITQEDLLKTRGTIHGAGSRARFRTAYWAAGLKGDMKEVYDEYGYPSARYREERVGIIEEKWTYMGAGKQFTFRGTKLVHEREISGQSASNYDLH
jgi:hypothetical protein